MPGTDRDSASSPPPFSDGWALFLDIDGTLLDHADHPSAVWVSPEVLHTLEKLHRRHGGALALISGRGLHDVDRLFAPLSLPSAGQHGVERRDGAGRTHRHALPEAGLRRAAELVSAFASRHPGLVFEDKGLNLALHYRMAPELEGEVERLIRGLAPDLGDQFELQSGKMVWEIKPSGLDKGTVIAEFMGEAPFLGRTPLFLGDDLTDELGFAAVNRMGGDTVKVGPGPSQARWRLPGAEAVRGWLKQLAERP